MTKVEKISTSKIDTTYYPSLTNIEDNNPLHLALEKSIKKEGIITPIITYKSDNGEYFLIDGINRLLIAKKSNISEIDCLLVENISKDIFLQMIYTAQYNKISQSTISKISFLKLAIDIAPNNKELLNNLFPLLGLKNTPQVLKKIEKIASLPEEIILFFHEKNFSYKQCVNLSQYPKDLLEGLFSFKDKLNITASVALELLDHIASYLKMHNIDYNTFINNSSIEEIMSSSKHNNQQRTKIFRDYIFQKRFPILSKTNEKMRSIKEKIDLDKNTSIQWDNYLENNFLTLTCQVDSSEIWPSIVENLSSNSVKAGISDLLKEL